MKLISNTYPSCVAPYKVALIGEAPGEQEQTEGKPFVGPSGYLLNQALREAGIDRDCCFVGNVYQYHPEGNNLANVDANLQRECLDRLCTELKVFQPEVIVPLGGYATGKILGKKNVSAWRGSILKAAGAAGLLGCDPWFVPTLHPAFVLRIWQNRFLLLADLIKAKEVATNGYTPNIHDFELGPSPTRLADWATKLETTLAPIAVDIECTIKDKRLLCVGFADSPLHAIVATSPEGLDYPIIKRLLENPNIPKVFHNAQFDMGVLEFFHNIKVQGLMDDTMLMHHACYPELRKSLAFITSIYTKEPYYKDEGKNVDEDGEQKEWEPSNDLSSLYTYNAKDCVCTYQCWQKLKGELVDTRASRGYVRDMRSVPIAMGMTLRGILVDSVRCGKELGLLEEKIKVSAAGLDATYGALIPPPAQRWSKSKPIPKSWNTTKIAMAQALPEMYIVDLTTSTYQKRLKDAPKQEVNSKSVPFLKWLLYEKLGLPKQYNEDDAGNQKLVVDSGALLKLANFKGGEKVHLILKDRQLRTLKAFFQPDTHTDGRIHAAFKVGGTETGRWASSESFLGGRNLMNIPDEFPKHTGITKGATRAIYRADDGFTMIAFDQSQAEARIVAYKSWLCTGDDSYKKLIEAGTKPHIWFGNILCDRGIFPPEARAEINAKEGIYYLVSKKSVHGFSYGMGPKTFKDSLLSETDGEVCIDQGMAKQIKLALYGVLPAIPRWHLAVQRKLGSKMLISATGRARNFLDRWGESMWKEAYAFEPQAVVADNTAEMMHRLADHTGIQFLQQGYDSVLLQVKDELVEGILTLIKAVAANQVIHLTDFDNINSVDIVIPITIKVGRNWGEMEEI